MEREPAGTGLRGRSRRISADVSCTEGYASQTSLTRAISLIQIRVSFLLLEKIGKIGVEVIFVRLFFFFFQEGNGFRGGSAGLSTPVCPCTCSRRDPGADVLPVISHLILSTALWGGAVVLFFIPQMRKQRFTWFK